MLDALRVRAPAGSGAGREVGLAASRLGRPFADLSCGISCSYLSTSSRARRRRLPRVSIEDGVWPASAGNPAEEATGSLGLSSLLNGREHIDEVVNEAHLLQVGSMLGEASSRAALLTGEAGGPVNHPTSFYGSADTDAFLSPWEPLITEGSSSVLYWAWRRPLRKGLFMYMTRSVFLEASPAELRAFMNDDAYRVVWDNAMAVLQPLADVQQGSGSHPGTRNASIEAMAAAVAYRANAAVGGGRPAAGNEVLPHETAVMQAQVQFPKPMASRSYIYTRRVWPRPSDGGCYCLSKSCTFPNPPPLAGRSVGVEDYCSGCVIKTPSLDLLPASFAGSAAEVLMVYFEDSHVRPGLANMGIRKGLWPLAADDLDDGEGAVGEMAEPLQALATASPALAGSAAFKSLGCSWQLLLGSATSPAVVNAVHGSFAPSSSKLSKVRSHPIGDWAHPGVVAKLKQLAGGPSMIRLPSHPLSAEDLLQGDMASSAAPASTCGCCIRKLVVKLMQAAGARLAHKLLSVLEHPGGGSVVDDACDGNGGDA
eukprot:gene6722-6941_t